MCFFIIHIRKLFQFNFMDKRKFFMFRKNHLTKIYRRIFSEFIKPIQITHIKQQAFFNILYLRQVFYKLCSTRIIPKIFISLYFVRKLASGLEYSYFVIPDIKLGPDRLDLVLVSNPKTKNLISPQK